MRPGEGSPRVSGQIVVGLIAVDLALRNRRGRAELRGANIWDLVDGVAAGNALELLIGQRGVGFCASGAVGLLMRVSIVLVVVSELLVPTFPGT